MRTYKVGIEAQIKIDKGKNGSHLAALVKQGREAEERIIQSHLPLVKAEARKFYLRNKEYVDHKDLIGAGNLGLVLALGRFDPKRGNRFSTYAIWWIRNAMSSLICKERWVMHIPDHIYRYVLQFLKVASELTQELGRVPSNEELAKKMEIPVRSVGWLQIWAGRETASLDEVVGEDGSSRLADFISDEQVIWRTEQTDRSEGVEGKLELQELRSAVASVLSTLTPREEAVLRMRFGFGDCKKDGLKDVGHRFELSEERIRQIEAQALRKLRSPNRSRRLEAFLRFKGESLK